MLSGCIGKVKMLTASERTRKEATMEDTIKTKRMSWGRRNAPAIATAGPVSFWMIVFVLLPMIYVVVISFMSRNVYGGIDFSFTLANYKEMLEPLYLKVIWKSFKLAVLTTVICLLLGYPLAYYIASKPSATAAKLIMLVMIPYWTNSLVRLYSYNLLGATNGPINNFLLKIGAIEAPLDLLYSDGVVIIGLLTAMLPFSVLPLYTSIEKLDKSLLEASKDLGANAFTTFRKVTIPLTMPGIVGCILLVFIPSLGMYYVPEALGGGKVMLIGSLIRNQFLVTKNWPFGASLAILIILMDPVTI